jgi:hypothetical protein
MIEDFLKYQAQTSPTHLAMEVSMLKEVTFTIQQQKIFRLCSRCFGMQFRTSASETSKSSHKRTIR